MTAISRRTEKTPSKAEWDRAEQRAEPRRQRSFCGQPGHTIRTCPKYMVAGR